MFAFMMMLACAGGPAADPSVCISGEAWTHGNSGSSRMNPGESCIGCHSRGEGPSYEAAGTVFFELDEPDDCYGVADVEVEITDADGQVVSLTTNEAGNFYTRADLAYPITARLLSSGAEVAAMQSAVSTGDCASCHTAQGDGGAPGRIVLD